MVPQAQEKYFDYSQRAQWLRAVVLGGLEGLAFTTVWLMGAEGVTLNSTTNEMKVMLASGTLALIAGTLRIATSELVSVYTQVDTINFQVERDLQMGRRSVDQRPPVPSAIQIAVAASLAYLFWGTIPILAAGFIKNQQLRFSIAIVAASLSMLMLGVIGAALGKASILRSCVRVLIGGFVAISIMWGKIRILKIILSFR